MGKVLSASYPVPATGLVITLHYPPDTAMLYDKCVCCDYSFELFSQTVGENPSSSNIPVIEL